MKIVAIKACLKNHILYKLLTLLYKYRPNRNNIKSKNNATFLFIFFCEIKQTPILPINSVGRNHSFPIVNITDLMMVFIHQ